jgi:hypothetical protein
MTATHATDSTTATGPVLYLAFELGRNTWKLVLRASVGSTEASKDVVARVGRIDRSVGWP